VRDFSSRQKLGSCSCTRRRLLAVRAAGTSVVVSGCASWHEGHACAAGALGRRPRLLAHVPIESYSGPDTPAGPASRRASASEHSRYQRAFGAGCAKAPEASVVTWLDHSCNAPGVHCDE